MMTLAIIAAAIGAAFVIGFLAGERRAVRECNRLLDSRLQDLLKAMIEGDRPMLVDADDEPEQPTVH